MKEEILSALDKMEKRGFKTHLFQTAEEMKAFLLADIPGDKSIGFGGSVTVTMELDLVSAFEKQGNPVYYHASAKPEDRAEVMRKAHTADVYMMSSNAVTYDGRLLNIDGNGNRVAALICGPETVYIVVGQNKFAADDGAAMDRAKNIAAAKNAKRLNKNTPCAKTGKCADCRSPERICNQTVWTEHVPTGRTYHICVALEDLGY